MDEERMADYVRRLRVHDELQLRYVIQEIYNRGFNDGYNDGCEACQPMDKDYCE